MIARVSEDGVKEDNSPKGDGNTKLFTTYSFLYIVKEDNSPKGDGNTSFNSIIYFAVVKEDNSPKGDGNPYKNKIRINLNS